MKSIELETLDRGRLLVNRRHAAALRDRNLASFDALMDHRLGQPVKAALRHRSTVRLELSGDDGLRTFYIKRHERAPLREYVKPWLHLRSPVVGARAEWEAMLRFHEVGIPTMTPVAFGRCGRRSLVMSLAIEGCAKLSEWMNEHLAAPDRQARRHAGMIARQVAEVARTMHQAKLHHQDFYLGHLLRSHTGHGPPIYVIDLGRVRRYRGLGLRWIVKDLAQLEFSARRFSRTDRVRFLRTYLGRRLRRRDRVLIGLIRHKVRSIERHAGRA